MEATNAAPTAQGHFRTFRHQVARKISYRDYIVSLAIGVLVPVFSKFLDPHGLLATIGVIVLVSGGVLFVDYACRGLWLLWQSYKRLQDALLQVQYLTTELRQQREQRIHREVGRVEFWWDHRLERDEEIWITGVTKWELGAIAALADYLEIDMESAKDKLWDFAVMDGSDVVAFLKRKIENLKKYLPTN